MPPTAIESAANVPPVRLYRPLPLAVEPGTRWPARRRPRLWLNTAAPLDADVEKRRGARVQRAAAERERSRSALGDAELNRGRNVHAAAALLEDAGAALPR